jgi:predicted acyltransferase
MSNTLSSSGRLVSLDQFRGYTVLGMFFVNIGSNFDALPAFFRHHNTYCSYADTIMPQFFFAVGFAYRLTLLKRLRSPNSGSAYGHVIWRSLALILLGFVLYHLDRTKSWADWQVFVREKLAGELLKRELFQTLVHIAVASIWVLPVMAASPLVRIGYACFSGILHLVLSYWFYYAWVHADPSGIDGGPLGFLTWAIPLLAGSVAYDVVAADLPSLSKFRILLGAGIIVMALGYGLSCIVVPGKLNPHLTDGITLRLVEPPLMAPAKDANDQLLFPPTLLTMNQRAGSISYLTFTAGFSLAVYALFFLACDVWGWRLGLFETLGSNALAAYILQDLVGTAVEAYAPQDSPWWYALGAFAVFLGICYLFLWHLQKHKLFLRL